MLHNYRAIELQTDKSHARDLSNGVIFNDLERVELSLTQMSRVSH